MARQIKNLNLNDKIKFGRHQINEEEPQSIIWRIAAKNHNCIPAYPSNSVTLHADRIIDLRPADARELTNPDMNRTKYGNNRYLHTNMLQWLNSNAKAGEWYNPKHEYDAPPDYPEIINNTLTYYAHRPGFLHYFSDKEINNILITTIRVTKSNPVDGSGYEDIESKIYFPSTTEIGLVDENGIAEGSRWEIYTDNMSRISNMTQHCLDNTKLGVSAYNANSPYEYWLRTVVAANSASFRMVSPTGIMASSTSYVGSTGVRPALNLSDDLLVSDEPDEDGYYTVIFDEPPVITAAPCGDLGTQTKPVKQTYTVTDTDGDSLTVTEKLNGEAVNPPSDYPSGTKLKLDLTTQWQSLHLDTPYTATIEVTDGILTTTHEWTFTRSNDAPSIMTEKKGYIGKLAIPFKQEYTVTDSNTDALTVTEKLDGQPIRTIPTQPSGTKLTFDLTDRWSSLSKDIAHTATVEVTDGLLTATHEWSFNVIDPIEQRITVQSAVQPTSVVIPVLPVEVLVTNNANDPEPVWEDATEAYLKRRQYSFKNNAKTADEWCVIVKYNVNGVSVPVKLTTLHEIKFS